MSVVPKNKLERVQFYENHLPRFSAHAAEIGTTEAEVTSLETKTQAARAAFSAQQVAIQAARAKTKAFYDAVDSMTVAGASILKQIRARAESTGNNSVYELAEIPGPGAQTPQPPPGEPRDFAIRLGQNGIVELKWKCDNPPGGGVVYHIYRRDEPNGPFYFLGGSPQRKYIDGTIPPGASQITYEIQGVSPRGVGPVAQWNVNFGVNAGGGMTASVTQTPRIAA